MDEKTIRAKVEDFFTRHAVGRTAHDAFPAWWLHREFDLPPAEAVACSSTGSSDHGLDAFYIEIPEGRDPTLHVIQAKLSGSRRQVQDGISGFRRTLERLALLLQGSPAPFDEENTVWTRLAARIRGIGDTGRMVIHCRVLHLAEIESETLLAEAKAPHAAFEEFAATLLPDHKIRLSLSGPLEIGAVGTIVVPGKKRQLAFEGVEVANEGAKLFIGLGKLADLVRLYEESGDSLFAKNVRLFNFRAADKKGPSHHVRESLRRACVGETDKRLDPIHFTMFHNGVTLHVSGAGRDGSTLWVRNPGVLNGCQTVKSAWLFLNDRLFKERIDKAAWDAIRVPLRVVQTTEEELVRKITVSNNRQTAIRPSAFRANDPVQLRLAEQLRHMGIYYERQEDAFQNLRRSDPRTLETDYANSFNAPLTMEELAQTIAVVSIEPALSVASKLSDLFEDPLYGRLFSERRLRSMHLLVFLSNLLRCVHLSLKDTRENFSRLEPMSPSRFRYPVARALGRWIVKNEPEVVAEFGEEIVARPGSSHPLRGKLRKLLSSRQMGIPSLIPDLWTNQSGEWAPATDREVVAKLLRRLYVHDFDVFEHYQEPR